jgi:two-component system, OmpR family, response regulator
MKPGKTVLLVDDDVDFLAANRLAFEAAGFTVHVAHNSTAAVEIANRVCPDAAILDVVMDRPDEGFALARKFRQDERTRSMKLVLLSSVNEINRRKGLAYRFSDQDRDEQWLPVDKVLEKPVKPKRLISIVEKLVESTA